MSVKMHHEREIMLYQEFLNVNCTQMGLCPYNPSGVWGKAPQNHIKLTEPSLFY